MQSLKKMKKEVYKQENRAKKKKVLKMFSSEQEEEEDNGEMDLKDIEFRMRKEKIDSQNLKYKDLMILKIILANGLYPQLSIGDEFNSDKSEPLFHTKVKPFNVLHPNGIFAINPEFITIDPIHIKDGASKYPISSKHQLLVYLSLLETNKPYLINLLRMPALQTFLLLAKTIDTNFTLGRFIFDSWIEIKFSKVSGATIILSYSPIFNFF